MYLFVRVRAYYMYVWQYIYLRFMNHYFLCNIYI